jgi:chemotaxis protein CheD
VIEIKSEPPEFYLMPGEVHLARSPAILKTVLGSCVGITFWIPRLGIGALCHGILPRSPQGIMAGEGYRYVDFAISDLARRFDAAGANRSEVQVKVFGGGDVIPALSGTARNGTVGRQNLEAALAVLVEEGFGVAAQDLGDTIGRVIQFNTLTGEVLLRRLQISKLDVDGLTPLLPAETKP